MTFARVAICQLYHSRRCVQWLTWSQSNETSQVKIRLDFKSKEELSQRKIHLYFHS